jgi:pimeloyl-ACP methyl ester carboxylesterase
MDAAEKRHQKALRLGRWINRISKISPKAAGRLAFQVFGMPFAGKLRAKDREFYATGEPHFFEIEKHKIATYEWKSTPNAPLLIFVHGWESNAARWRYFIREAIKLGYHVVAFDAPAHGDSSGKHINLPLYMQVLAEIGRKFGPIECLIGHSFGGAAIMQTLAKTDIPRPKSTIIIGSYERTAKIFEDYVQYTGMIPLILEQLKKEVFRVSGRTLDDFNNSLAVKNLGDIRALFLHDVGDEICPIQDARNNHAAWLGSKLVETTGLGHKMQHISVVHAVFNFIKHS